MKALDTSLLLGLLEGDPRVRATLRRWRGMEIATTEANLLELYTIAWCVPGRRGAARVSALERLRRHLTVLPLDSRSVEMASGRVPKDNPATPLMLGMLTALEANGCDELATERPSEIPGRWAFRVSSHLKPIRKTTKNRH